MKRAFRVLLSRLAMFSAGGYSIRPRLQSLRGVKIGRRVWISQGVYFDELYPEAISIGDNCTIGYRAAIFTHFHWGPRRDSGGFKPVVLERDVFLGPLCLILPGVKIGEGSVIKGGSVVTSNVPPGTFWGPPPAGPLGLVGVPLTPDHTYEEFVQGLKFLRPSRSSSPFPRPPE